MDVKFFKSHIMKNLLLIFCFMLFAHAAFSQVQVVTLNGSASNDPDGQIQNYKWAQVGTTPMPCTITNANGAIATVVPSGGLQWVPGVYSFILTVTDNLGATSSATTNITVTSNPPTVDAGNSQTVQLPLSSVSLKASGTATLGIVRSWTWSQVSGPNTAIFSRKDVSAVDVSNLAAGTYFFKVTVVDNYGVSVSDTVSITVKAVNQSPKADAGTDKTITLPSTSVAIGGNDNPSNVSVVWHKKSGGAAIISSPKRSVTKVTLFNSGKYVFVKRVTDRKGNSATDEVVVTLNKKPASNSTTPKGF
jgi:hypothetical protein